MSLYMVFSVPFRTSNFNASFGSQQEFSWLYRENNLGICLNGVDHLFVTKVHQILTFELVLFVIPIDVSLSLSVVTIYSTASTTTYH